MNFQDMQNAVLAKGRLLGINWGSTPTNNTTSFNPPYQVALYLNIAYNEFLSRTNAYPIAALQVSFPTQANVNSYPIRPLPVFETLIPIDPGSQPRTIPNPAALRIYEFVYQTGNAQSRRVLYVSTARFRQNTNQYLNRFGSYSSYPVMWTQLFGGPNIDIWPGTATTSDNIHLTICPDPMTTGTSCTAAAGGVLVNGTDIPLFPPQFHMSLVHHAVSEICDAANKPQQAATNMALFEKQVQEALLFGAAFGEGDPEQTIDDCWGDVGL